MYLFLFGFFLLIIGIIFLIKANKQKKEEFEEYIKKQQKELDYLLKDKKEQLNSVENQLNLAVARNKSETEKYEVVKKSTQDMIIAEKRRGESEIAAARENARIQLEGAEALERQKMNQRLIDSERQLQRAYVEASFLQEEIFTERESEIQEELNKILAELNEWKAKRDAINEQIRKEEELENEIDFHRIQLNKNSKEDIFYLLSIEENIHNKELLHKLIWSEYIQREFNQMIKNVLGNRSPKNVIYCIENINNKKKYIGKTKGEVKSRWTEHVKSSLGIGTISHQPIHDALCGHWDEFTFSILEEVEDEKLSDREHYYITFFDSHKYGYNVKE